MASVARNNVSYRLLNRLSDLVICSSCLRSGKVTPVPQVISGRHALTNECAECRTQKIANRNCRKAAISTLKIHH